MESCKIYVDVDATFTKDGRLLPRSLIWTDGHRYEIQRIKNICRAASLRAGGVGMRYTCVIDGKVSHLYYEDNNMWLNKIAARWPVKAVAQLSFSQ